MHQSLVRQTSLFGALVLGLGSILGTGAYVSTVLAVDIAGSLTIISVLIAAFTALCNGLSSAQLSAAHPVSGGTYEYGYQFLTPTAGFVAGSFFIIAKSASAATAALAVGAYFMTAYELPVVAGKLIAGTLIVLFWSGIFYPSQSNNRQLTAFGYHCCISSVEVEETIRKTAPSKPLD